MPPPIPRGAAPPPLPLSKTQGAASTLSPPNSALSPQTVPTRALTPPPFPTSPSSPTSPTTPHTPSTPNPHSHLPLPSSSSSSSSSSRSRFGTLQLPLSSLHSQSESSLLTHFTALKETTTNRAAARKIARNKETIATLLEAIRSKPNFTKMVEYSLECLRNLAVDEGSVEEMLEEDVVDVVMTVLKLNPYNEKIQSMANALLSSFVINDHTAQVVGAKTYPHTHTHHPHSTPCRLTRIVAGPHPLLPCAAVAGVLRLSSTPCASTWRAAR